MLGRQQIAGIPTALSELFKNAYDAYARHAEVDYFRKHKLLLMRDDGVGMTKEDIEQRWLVLGTESKLQDGGAIPIPPPEGRAARPVLGEKGIGRLAIAAIGSVVLLVSRAERLGRLHDPVVALLAWGLFEVPGLDLEEIEVPLRELSDARLPSRAIVKDMVEELRGVVERTAKNRGSKTDDVRFQRIRSDLGHIERVDPARLVELLPKSNLDGRTGTCFFVCPTDPVLESDLDADDDNMAPPIVKVLGGFANSMTPSRGEIDFAVAFRDHLEDGSPPHERIGPSEFFSQADFDACDHALMGDFDAEGTFTGQLRVFDNPAIDVCFNRPRALQKTVRMPGPFRLSFAYLQGVKRDSMTYRRDPALWNRLRTRINELGGIYLYRDGVRILPYGGPDYDWLGVERRRTQGASYYFFSHRRMLGAVELSREANSGLQEKAGREGFQENAEFRALRGLVQELLIWTASEFFREDSPSDVWRRQRKEMAEAERLRRRRDAGNRAKARELDANLERALDLMNEGVAEQELRASVDRYEVELSAASEERDLELRMQLIERAHLAALQRHEETLTRLRVPKPKGVGLPGSLQAAWNGYQTELEKFESRVVARERARLDAVTEKMDRGLRTAMHRRRATLTVVDRAAKAGTRRVRDAEKRLAESIDQLQHQSRGLGVSARDDLERAITAQRALLDGPVASPQQIAPDEAIVRTANAMADRLTTVAEAVEAMTAKLRSGDDDPTGLDTLAALEDELIARREKEDDDADLIQVGMAIQVIDHEFGASIQSVREALRSLKPWADRNPTLRPVHDRIRTAFDHLDGYLTLFTPFHRRLYRGETSFRGEDVRRYLANLFAGRLERDAISLESTQTFDRLEIHGYPSTFYPVFVNLVDNATYWLKDASRPRRILLDLVDRGIVVSDSGPGVPVRYRARIFERGFSKKPEGRGLGLYISQKSLADVGWSLDLVDEEGLGGATFRLSQNDRGDT
jgi:signal transduction histidine kinase